jgi:hypothetical protein
MDQSTAILKAMQQSAKCNYTPMIVVLDRSNPSKPVTEAFDFCPARIQKTHFPNASPMFRVTASTWSLENPPVLPIN